ncbi:MAG: ClpXP protease specificity-enhancing factor SspB [Pseudomonadota bacterium]|nr:ClpXP protease specificity-enhancing factor SspB [Pseudomonadota bacterium]
MSEDLIRYDILAQEALRSVIRKVLDEISRAGLPGEHHFFITFQTDYPGVRLSKRMAERYPEEMTIVIQHTYWNLEVGENAFEIDLSFDDIRERLRVPYAAIKGFFDPSVKFGLQFDVVPTDGKAALVAGERKPPGGSHSGQGELRKMGSGSVPEIKPGIAGNEDKATDDDGAASAPDSGSVDSGTKVVSLETFRKKK